MEKEKIDDILIRKWLDGELTNAKIEELGSLDVFKDYKRIIDATDNLGVSDYNAEELLSKINQKKNSDSKPVKRLKPWMYSAAAAILILFGYLFFANQTTSYETGYGEQLVVILPDNSKVRLNANSSLEFKENSWNENRNLQFEGEGFFEVEKGNRFIVNTPEGTVEVLGTKFNVISQENIFEVMCQEGKVKASNSKGDSEILTFGMGVRMINDNIRNLVFNGHTPSWINGESSFNDSQLSQVIIALQNQFGITIKTNKIDEAELFTGSFTHSDLNLALKTVFDAMEISYTFENEKEIVLNKTQ